LLIFSRRERVAPRVIDLNALVRGIEELMRRTLGEQIALEFALDPNLPAVRVDPGTMEQVLLNLAVNARDAMPDGGVLWVETLAGDDWATVGVSDTGAGMSADVRKRAFEPF